MRLLKFGSVLLFIFLRQVNCRTNLELFEELLPGTFDNEQDTECTGRPVADRIHSTVIAVDVPALAPAVTFYIEQYSSNDPNNINRQRIYAAEENENGEIPMKIYRLIDEERFRYGYYSSNMFDSLTLDDLQHTEGCDVIWSLPSDGVFESQMLQNECYISGGTVRLEDSNELGPKHLSVVYNLYDRESDILLFQMTNNMSRIEPRTPAKSSSEVYAALLEGKEVRFDIDISLCSAEGNARNTSYTLYGSDANMNFKLINFTGVPIPYVVFSSQKDHRDLESGDVYQRYGQVAMYLTESTRVRLKLINWDEKTKEVLASDTLWCDTDWTTENEESAPVKFYLSSANGKMQLGHFNDLYRALREGQEVYHVTTYLGCDLDDGTPSNSPVIMGGKIMSYDVTGNMLQFSHDDVISNQQGGVDDPFVTNKRYIQITPSGHVTCQIGNYDLEGEETVISTRHCKINGQYREGTVYFYTAPKAITYVCN